MAFLDVELTENATQAVVDVLRSARGPELANTVVSSFDAGALAQRAERALRWPRRFNADELDDETLGLAARLGCSAVAAPWTAIDHRSAKRARAAGLGVVAWTVQRRATFDHLASLGVVAECIGGDGLRGAGHDAVPAVGFGRRERRRATETPPDRDGQTGPGRG